MKIRRKSVVIITAVAAVIIAAVGLYLFTDIRYFFFHTSSAPVHAKTNADFQIADIHSAVDADGDGIDDQTDILQGARDYIATNPRYKSKYYEGGYPNDGYGVCTDLVAYALRNAGYDLRALVDADIAANREMYAVDAPDDNIDYRRVRNLKVFFGHTAISLTTDIYDIAAWQGGDIVIFENHIGIVSDHRNDDGIAYVIHHNGTMQKAYEEDILAERDDIVGHYRMSAAE
ncbi:MAG: DUF1287 domain-containing protein [Lachnospiraceae bacterium]|nr:DUF1287 domain-containing protein [Lachnospiraceae bacterium]